MFKRFIHLSASHWESLCSGIKGRPEVSGISAYTVHLLGLLGIQQFNGIIRVDFLAAILSSSHTNLRLGNLEYCWNFIPTIQLDLPPASTARIILPEPRLASPSTPCISIQSIILVPLSSGPRDGSTIPPTTIVLKTNQLQWHKIPHLLDPPSRHSAPVATRASVRNWHTWKWPYFWHEYCSCTISSRLRTRRRNIPAREKDGQVSGGEGREGSIRFGTISRPTATDRGFNFGGGSKVNLLFFVVI